MSFKDKLLNISYRKELKDWNKKQSDEKKRTKKLGPHGVFGINWKICKAFKNEYSRKSAIEKIARLREIAEVKINNPRPYHKRRMKRHPIKELKPCWICREVSAEVEHHMIQVMNGGYDCSTNRLKICNQCHLEIHDHLKLKEMEKKMDIEYEEAVARDSS